MRTETLTGTEALDRISCLIHDQRFPLSEVRFDETAKTVELPTQFLDDERRRVRQRRWCDIVFVPERRVVLRFANVKALSIEDPDRIEIYMLNELRYDYESSRLIIETCMNCVLFLTIDPADLNIEFDIGRIQRVHRFIAPPFLRKIQRTT